MKNEKELYKSTLVSAGRAALSDNPKGGQLSQLLIFQSVLLAGAEAVKVIFRKNFKKDSIDLLSVGIACFCFAGISAFSFWQMSKTESDVDYFRGAIYAAVTLFVVWQGVAKHAKSSDTNPNPDGESDLLGFLYKDGVSSTQIQYVYEPIVLLSVGIFYCFFDIWGGVPLIGCGVSVWVKWAVNSILLDNRIQKSINEKSAVQYPSANRPRYTAK